MRLHRIKLGNYRGVVECEVRFPSEGVTIIEGDNEVGKTSLAEAVDLILEFQDSSSHRRVKAVQPVGRDEGAEVEIEVSTGSYRFVFTKRWHRNKGTTLELIEPERAQLVGREAHEKVVAILAETLDAGLWAALRLEQGTELAQASFGETSLGRALDLAAGGDRDDDRESDLWDRIRAERDRYWTATGQVKGDRSALAGEVRAARAVVADVEGSLGELEDATDEMERLEVEAGTLETSRTEHARAEAALAQRAEVVTRRRSEVRQLCAERGTAAAERDKWDAVRARRRELVEDVEHRVEALTGRQAELDRTQPARVAAEQRNAEADEALEQARAARRVADDDHRRAVADRDHRRHEIELEQLSERHGRVVEAQARLSEADAHLETARVDDALMDRIDAAHLELAKAEAAAKIGAATVETTALRAVELEVDGRAHRLAADTIEELEVTDTLELVVPDVVRLRVRAGAEARGLADQLRKASEAFDGLCRDGGVEGFEEARVAAAARAEAERTRAEAVKGIEQDLRDLTPHVLAEKIARLTDRIDDYGRSRAAEPALPVDFEAAQALVSVGELALDDRDAEHERRDADARKAAVAVQEAQKTDLKLVTELDHARAALVQAELVLAEGRAGRSDDQVDAELAIARDKLATFTEKLEAAEEGLAAEDPESLDALLENARAAAKRAADELHQNRERRRDLRVMLDLRGEEGLARQLDEAKTRLEHLTRELDRLEARAAAALLLYETFATRRAEARHRYVAPFRERIEALGRIVFGPTLEVELDGDLRVARRTLDGVTVDFEQLSTGAQEQLGIIGRLACAAIVAGDGGAPVIFDDALGWTDPRRLERMGATIAAAGRECQIIVLTCTPGRYSSVGTATVIKLPT